MLWDQCVVLCIYEHGHDNVVRRLAATLTTVLWVSREILHMRIICAGSGLPELSNKKIVRESGFSLSGSGRSSTPPAVFTLPSIREV